MYCIKCGKENGEKTKICYYCGALLYRPGEEPKTTTQTLVAEETKPAESDNNNEPKQPSFTPYQPPVDAYKDKTPFSNFNAPFFTPLNQEDVFKNPYLFYNYKNKDNQQVYAAYAPFTMRFAAAFIDTIIMSFPLFIITYLYSMSLTPQQQLDLVTNPNGSTLPNWASLIWYTLYLIYCVILTTKRGQTVGKMILGIKVITKDGNKPDWNTSLIRNLFGYSWVLGAILLTTNTVFTLLGFILQIMVMLGFAIAGMDLKRQGWHDKLAGTLVVRKREFIKGQKSEVSKN
jgi:uncharacterized RDD family membrane protein YckC